MLDARHPTEGWVRLADRVIPLAALRDRPAGYAPLFARAKAELGHGDCLCRTPPLRLVVRCTRAGRYHLAGWPGEGDKHDPGCAFHKLLPSDSGRTGYTRAAIQDMDTGTAIRFELALTRQLLQARGSSMHRETQSGPSRAAVSPLGLLHWLWEEAQLSSWNPRWRHRGWGVCHSRLRQQADSCLLNGQDLTEILYVVPPFHPASATRNAQTFEAFRTRLQHQRQAVQRGLVLGEIKESAATRYGVRYRLAHLRGALFASTKLHERACRSYRAAFAHTAKAGTRRVGLFVVEASPRGYLQVLDLAVMLCSRLYIPADSSFEAQMANQLAAAGRSYLKPLRYDTSDAVLPDFLLVDVTPWQVVEVYGIRGRESYERRKRAKQVIYRQRGAPLLEWDVAQPMPDLSLAATGHPPGSRLPHQGAWTN
ncbi:DUF1173 family protein [Streptomyces sp. 7N604]|uniref:DUF1173 family protein n=1 Tax=Streptomyces sp. 7N604 TaxID=3457415 RepID=UPI003FD44F3A